MANTYVDYTAVASQTDYNFSFEYLQDDHVKVKVNGALVTNYTIVTSPTPTKIRFNTAPDAGATIKIYRDSRGNFAPLVDFVDGSVLTQEPLDLAYKHNLFTSQEASEGQGGEQLTKKGLTHYDAEGNKIINLGSPTTDGDAANKAYVDQTIDNAELVGGSPATVSLGVYDVTSTNDTLKQLRAWTADIETNASNITDGITNANIDVTSTGSTTARSLKDRFADVVNVLDYGADNTGATDAKSAIQAAIDAGNKIYMPAGTYRIDSSVLLKDNTHIFGDGIDATIVQEAGNSYDFTISLFINENYNNATGNDNIIVSDISFKGKNNTPITDGTLTSYVSYLGSIYKCIETHTSSPSETPDTSSKWSLSTDVSSADAWASGTLYNFSTLKGIGGVYLGYCVNSAITNCLFRDGWSGFVITETQTGYTEATNIRIDNCVVFNSTSWSQNGELGTPRGFNLGTKAVKATNCACYGSATGFYINADLGVFNGLYSIDWNDDNGFYIIGDFQKFSNCVAEGNNFGNGFSIAYSYGSEYNNCIAKNCSNMGFRLHAPQSDTRFANISSYDCGYCIRTENTTTYTPTSVTSSAGVVTVTLAVDAADNRFRANDAVYIDGVNEAGYNGVWKIESVSGNTLTYKSADAVTSPATGTIVVRHAVSNLQFDNVLVDNPTFDTIELSKADNIQFNNVTVKSNSNGYGMDIEDCKNLTVNNSTFYDTKDQAIDVLRSENVTIDNINVHNCNTDGGTGATDRGAIRIKSVVGVSITNVKGTSPSPYFIYQDGLNEGSSPSSGYIKNNKRTDGANNDWSYAGVHYEHVGTGTPEGNVVSGIGAIYYRQDGGAGTTLYIKESGTGNTGWVAK